MWEACNFLNPMKEIPRGHNSERAVIAARSVTAIAVTNIRGIMKDIIFTGIDRKSTFLAVLWKRYSEPGQILLFCKFNFLATLKRFARTYRNRPLIKKKTLIRSILHSYTRFNSSRMFYLLLKMDFNEVALSNNWVTGRLQLS